MLTIKQYQARQRTSGCSVQVAKQRAAMLSDFDSLDTKPVSAPAAAATAGRPAPAAVKREPVAQAKRPQVPVTDSPVRMTWSRRTLFALPGCGPIEASRHRLVLFAEHLRYMALQLCGCMCASDECFLAAQHDDGRNTIVLRFPAGYQLPSKPQV